MSGSASGSASGSGMGAGPSSASPRAPQTPAAGAAAPSPASPRAPQAPAAGAAAPAPAFPLLALPQPCLLAVFDALSASLEDAVALSLTCKELFEHGAAARRRYMCCATCGHAVFEPACAFAAAPPGQEGTPRMDFLDGDSYAVDPSCLGLSVAELLGQEEQQQEEEEEEGGEAAAMDTGAPSSSKNSSGGGGMGGRSEAASPGSPSAKHQGAVLGPEKPMEAAAALFCLRSALGIRRAGDRGHEVRAREVLCGGCGLHLGLVLTQMGRLRAGATAACISNWRELQLLGTCFLGQRYLRLRRPCGAEDHLGRPPPPQATAVYRCTAARSKLRPAGCCGAELFESRDILSRGHCWDAGGGPERAFFVNGVRPGSVAVRDERQETLCQGDMRVADAYCATCGARIGWKFCADLSPALENCNQVGRFGIVRSSIQKGSGKGAAAGSSRRAAKEQAAPA